MNTTKDSFIDDPTKAHQVGIEELSEDVQKINHEVEDLIEKTNTLIKQHSQTKPRAGTEISDIQKGVRDLKSLNEQVEISKDTISILQDSINTLLSKENPKLESIAELTEHLNKEKATVSSLNQAIIKLGSQLVPLETHKNDGGAPPVVAEV